MWNSEMLCFETFNIKTFLCETKRKVSCVTESITEGKSQERSSLSSGLYGAWHIFQSTGLHILIFSYIKLRVKILSFK